MYNYLKQRVKHAIRFRHKRGFGVHSPFVFDLITNVIKERNLYYDFERIETRAKLRSSEKKLCRLLFRLSDYLSYRNVLLLGLENPFVISYLEAVSRDMRLFYKGKEFKGERYEKVEPASIGEVPLDMMFLGRELDGVWSAACESLLRERKEGPLCVIITDIYKKPLNAQLWRQWRKECTVSIDMMWYGMLFFDNRLQRGRYNMII